MSLGRGWGQSLRVNQPDPLHLRAVSRPVRGLDLRVKGVQAGTERQTVNGEGGGGLVGERGEQAAGAEEADGADVVGIGGNLNVVGSLNGGRVRSGRARSGWRTAACSEFESGG